MADDILRVLLRLTVDLTEHMAAVAVAHRAALERLEALSAQQAECHQDVAATLAAVTTTRARVETLLARGVSRTTPPRRPDA